MIQFFLVTNKTWHYENFTVSYYYYTTACILRLVRRLKIHHWFQALNFQAYSFISFACVSITGVAVNYNEPPSFPVKCHRWYFTPIEFYLWIFIRIIVKFDRWWRFSSEFSSLKDDFRVWKCARRFFHFLSKIFKIISTYFWCWSAIEI